MNSGRKNKGFQLPKKMFEIDPETGREVLIPLRFSTTSVPRSGLPKIKTEIAARPLEPLNFKDLMPKGSPNTKTEIAKRPVQPLNYKESMPKVPRTLGSIGHAATEPDNKMNSERKSKAFQFPKKMFDIDPITGKEVLIPLSFGTASLTRSGLPKAKTEIPKRPLEPLNFKELMQGDPEEIPAKIRKTDASSNPSRRLFESTSYTSRPSLNRKSLYRRKPVPKKNEPVISSKTSPLLNMEEVEQQLLKNKNSLRGYPFKSPDIPKTKFTKLANSKSKTKKLDVPVVIVEEIETIPANTNHMEEEPHEPKTPDSIDEFHNLEQFCKDSPVTSMCNLMQGAVINSAKRTILHNDSEITNLVKDIEQMILEEQIRHENTMLKLNKILLFLKKLDDTEDRNKENNSTHSNRRSERLLRKTPTKNSKLLTSPAILKSDDLRKSTLKKNLVAKNGDYEVKSPLSEKAIKLYNTLRAQSTFLETPKSDRKGNNLSSRLQMQCRMLQDTPVHK